MSKFRVRFYRHTTTADRHEIEVAADSPAAARQRVLDWAAGRLELSDDEEQSEELVREGEIVNSVFDELWPESSPNAVTEVTEG